MNNCFVVCIDMLGTINHKKKLKLKKIIHLIFILLVVKIILK